MSVKPLLDQLHRDALEERERRLAAARAGALRLAKDAHDQLQRERQDALDERARVLRVELDLERALVARQCQLEELHTRRHLVDRCLTRAMTPADSLLESSGFKAALQRQVARSVSYLPEGECRVRCSAAIEPDVRLAFAGQSARVAEITVDDANAFGFVVESRDGRVTIDATLARLIAQERDALAIAIVKRHQQALHD